MRKTYLNLILGKKKTKNSLFISILSIQVTGPIILTILFSLKDRRNILSKVSEQCRKYIVFTIMHIAIIKLHLFGAKQQGLQCKNMK